MESSGKASQYDLLALLDTIFRIDNEGSNKMLNSLMYKMCYYRFGQVYTEGGEKQLKKINKNHNHLFLNVRSPTGL